MKTNQPTSMQEPLLKKDLIDEVSKSTGKTKAVVREIVDAIKDVTLDAIKGGRHTFVLGLGKIEIRRREARKARDIRRGTTVMVPARTVAYFLPSDALQEAAAAAPKSEAGQE